MPPPLECPMSLLTTIQSAQATSEVLDRRLDNLCNMQNEYRTLLFLEAGGCPRCRGEKRIVTWSTLDYSGSEEYGPCPEMNNYNHELQPYMVSSGGIPEMDTTNMLRNTLKVLRLALGKMDNLSTVSKGKTVVVNRGRKVPIGTTGTVVGFVQAKSYGYHHRPNDRVGIKDDAGEVHWTSVDNVDVVLEKPEGFEALEAVVARLAGLVA